MSAADALHLAARLGVTIRPDGEHLRLVDVPPGPAGDALVDLVRQHKADLLDSLIPTSCLVRVWICPCGMEVRADLLTCVRSWCGRPRRGPVFSYE